MCGPRALLRKGSEKIAIVMVIGEGAEFEKIPNAVVRELKLRAATQIAGQKSKHILRTGLQTGQQFSNAGQKRSLPLRQLIDQKFKILLEKGGRIFLGHSDIQFAQNLVDDAGISPARNFDAGKIVGHPEFVPKHRFERSDAGPLGIDKSAVDVEEEEAFCHSCAVAILTERRIVDHILRANNQ